VETPGSSERRSRHRTAENRGSCATLAHPWFGPFTADQWHFMAAFHMRLHRGQIKAILRGE
jgi:hypothetical protein